MQLLISQQEPHISESTQLSEDPNPPKERSKRRKLPPTEDVVLCSSWLNTSKDPVLGNEQKAEAFWKRVTHYFNSSPKLAGLTNRETNHCKQRWHRINDLVSKFVGCYEDAKSQKTSGYNEADCIKVAYEIFYDDYGINFNLEHAWMEFCNDQKWCTPSTSKGDGSSKKRKDDDPTASSDTVNPVEARPPGVKASKAKGKKSVSKTSSVETEGTTLLQFQTMWTIKEKDLSMRDRLKKMDLLDSLIARTDSLSEEERALKNKLINEMLSN